MSVLGYQANSTVRCPVEKSGCGCRKNRNKGEMGNLEEQNISGFSKKTKNFKIFINIGPFRNGLLLEAVYRGAVSTLINRMRSAITVRFR